MKTIKILFTFLAFISLTVVPIPNPIAKAEAGSLASAQSYDPSNFSWYQITQNSGTPPSPRLFSEMAYDEAIAGILLFGGQNGNTYYNDTWVYQGNQWLSLPTTTTPDPRAAQGFAYDKDRKRIVMFGGSNNSNPDGISERNDTWEFDGKDWHQTTPQNAQTPARRAYPGMVYRSAAHQIVMFGGWGPAGPALNDTYSYNGATWSPITLQSGTTPPPARFRFGMVYDEARDRIILFGGCTNVNCSNTLGDTWEFDGQEWKPIPTTNSPGARAGFAMVYDPAIQKTLLFGGFSSWQGSGVGKSFSDTWVYDGMNWTPLTLAYDPGPRYDMSASYDNGGHIVLFGGHSSTQAAFGDTWQKTDTHVLAVPLFFQGKSSHPAYPNLPLNILPDNFQPGWGSVDYDHDAPYTMGDEGCNATSNAMVLNYWFQAMNITEKMDPGVLNDDLTKITGGYTPEHLVSYNAVAAYARTKGALVNVAVRYDKPVVDRALEMGYPVILGVNNNKHFVVATAKIVLDAAANTYTYIINDPVYGYTTLARWYGAGQAWSKEVIYYSPADEKRLFDASFLQTLKSPIHAVVTDPLGRKEGFDPRTNTRWDEIQGALYTEEGIDRPDGSSVPTEKDLFIPDPVNGDYITEIIGTGDGNYEIDTTLTRSNGESKTSEVTGVASANSDDFLTTQYVDLSKKVFLPIIIH